MRAAEIWGAWLKPNSSTVFTRGNRASKIRGAIALRSRSLIPRRAKPPDSAQVQYVQFSEPGHWYCFSSECIPGGVPLCKPSTNRRGDLACSGSPGSGTREEGQSRPAERCFGRDAASPADCAGHSPPAASSGRHGPPAGLIGRSQGRMPG